MPASEKDELVTETLGLPVVRRTAARDESEFAERCGRVVGARLRQRLCIDRV